jgi:hypothetical protein
LARFRSPREQQDEEAKGNKGSGYPIDKDIFLGSDTKDRTRIRREAKGPDAADVPAPRDRAGLFNQPENAHGEYVKYIILDKEHLRGLDLYYPRYIWMLDQMDDAILEQTIGRATRFCGQARGNVYEPTPGVGWPLFVFEFTMPYTPAMVNATQKKARTAREEMLEWKTNTKDWKDQLPYQLSLLSAYAAINRFVASARNRTVGWGDNLTHLLHPAARYVPNIVLPWTVGSNESCFPSLHKAFYFHHIKNRNALSDTNDQI